MKLTVREMEYHQPGWSIDLDGAHFMTWAPRGPSPDGSYSGQRDQWSASWGTWEIEDPDAEPVMMVEGSSNGDFQYGDTLDEALKAFDTHPDQELASQAKALLRKAAK